jgi:hypothetical protein
VLRQTTGAPADGDLSGLKPQGKRGVYGTAEAVPLTKPFADQQNKSGKAERNPA